MKRHSTAFRCLFPIAASTLLWLGTSHLPAADDARPLPKHSAEYDYDPPVPGSYSLPTIQPAADGEVLDADGNPHRLRKLLDGRITILSFIYTRCADPKACPLASGILHQVHRLSAKDPALAENLLLLTFSFDPDHDTPRVMAGYGDLLKSREQAADWKFLTTGSTSELAPILQAYGQRVDRKKNPADTKGPFYHNLRVYLIDGQGRIRNIYSQGLLDPRLLLADIRTLILEKERQVPSE